MSDTEVQELKQDFKDLRDDHIKFGQDFASFKGEILSELRSIRELLKTQNDRTNKRESEIEALRLLYEQERTEQDKTIERLGNRLTAVETSSKTMRWALGIGLSAVAAFGALGIYFT